MASRRLLWSRRILGTAVVGSVGGYGASKGLIHVRRTHGFKKDSALETVSLTCERVHRASYILGVFGYTFLEFFVMKKAVGAERFWDVRLDETHRRGAGRIKNCLITSGGVMVKFGQELAAMRGFLPPIYVSTMAELRDNVPSVPWEEMEAVLEVEFGRPIKDLFLTIDKTPLAAASLAQVHRATLIDGSEAAVKIQYPIVASFLEVDIGTHKVLSHVFNRFNPEFERREDVHDKLYSLLRKELDFENEAKNCERAHLDLVGVVKGVYVPKVIHNMTTRSILTMEFIDGIRVDDIAGIERLGFDKKEIATALFNAIAEQMFSSGHIHADPHQGNVLLRRPPSSPGTSTTTGVEVVILDHGLCGTIGDDFRMDFARFWRSLVLGDTNQLEKFAEKYNLPDHKIFAMLLMMQRYDHIGVGMGVDGVRDRQFETGGEVWWERKTSKDEDEESDETRTDEEKKVVEEEKEAKKKERKDKQVAMFEKLTATMNNLPPDMFLVLRALFLLRSVNADLGAPVNRYALMSTTANRVVEAHDYPSLGFWSRAQFTARHFWFGFRLNVIERIGGALVMAVVRGLQFCNVPLSRIIGSTPAAAAALGLPREMSEVVEVADM
eukprot:TRINITY_DN3984_c0_g1_i1.p1 TRINITY_DN3984_c0_g1~~TRINITY_DN3984_c0_g1_i1.p1  ORF type:complete len:610 (-),score=150.54 TRINITY_DN3984_c0_g1_i1:165-1994(-)